MLDDQSKNAHGVALKELQEETGLTVEGNELFALNNKPLYSSAGASDEALYFFGCIKEVDDDIFNSFKGKKCGNSNEHEFITVELVSSDELFTRTTSLQVMVGIYLFNRYRKQISYSL